MVQEVTTTSWGKRIASAFLGMMLGLGLIIGSFWLVFWNEGNGLRTAQSLQQTAQILITVPNSPIDPQNNLKVVHFSGLATTDDQVSDALLGLSEKAIKLERTVEMYQWTENVETKTEKNLGGSETETKTYTYKPVWSQEIIHSSEFKDSTGHQNPVIMPVKSEVNYAQKVTVGDFILPQPLVQSMEGATPVELSKIDTTALKDRMQKPIQNYGNELYVGTNAQTPAVGDLRIRVTEVLPQTVSIIAQQTENTLQSYMAPGGMPVSLLYMGQKSSAEMINQAQSENQLMTWLFRLLSLVMMIIGLSLLLKPISVMADIIPIIGSITEFGTSLIAFLLGLALWVIATAIAWFVVRPLWSIALIIIMLGIGYALVQRRRRKLQVSI